MDAVHDAIDMLDARAPIAGAQIQRLADEAREAPSRTLQIPFVGRLVWRRFLSELIECARQERLEFRYDVDPRLFSVGLTVTVHGELTGIAGFEFMVERLLLLYRPSFG
jgi:hypothetical protein